MQGNTPEAPKLVPTIKRRRSRKMNNDFAPKITNITISERKEKIPSDVVVRQEKDHGRAG